VLENVVLRKIFGIRSDEVIGEWSRLYNEELYALYCSSNIIGMMKSRRLKWGVMWHVWVRGEVGKPEGKRTFERRTRRW
jgi:hypothetical protein